ncbi:MAG: hypothetical protein JXO49_01690 [Deltaproteobacteria bacterium]|nr:hypothetical protein [Candidatus Anaeroferrophillus wilburensis]MBN2888038.1 hypothetical protein [Deltaproteobacteria bacterium]
MMRRMLLGRTGLEVSEVCFGALPMGPLQKNLPVDVCRNIIVRALRGGIDFIDTAQMYKTYEPIRLALKQVPRRPVLASKSTAARLWGNGTGCSRGSAGSGSGLYRYLPPPRRPG